MKKSKINYIFSKLSRIYPNPEPQLNYVNKYTFLIAVVLSAQSTDISVNKVTKDLFKIVKKPIQMISLGENKLKKYIRTIGLYNSKAKNIILLSKILISKYKSFVPRKFDNLISLPGVGNKTASVYQNVILKKPKIAVDTHVFRVSNRLGIVEERTADKTQKVLEKIVPNKWKRSAHLLLILHGRKICKAQKPNCKKCKLFSYCKFPKKCMF